jgi:hypothetical protein
MDRMMAAAGGVSRMKKRPENLTRYLLELPSFEEQLILRGHLLLEVALEEAITRSAHNPFLLKIEEERGFSFAQKVRIAAGFGVLDAAAVAALKALNKLRNQLSHRSEFAVTTTDVAVLTKYLPASEPTSWDEVSTSPMIAERTANERELLRFLAWLLSRIATRSSVARTRGI